MTGAAQGNGAGKEEATHIGRAGAEPCKQQGVHEKQRTSDVQSEMGQPWSRVLNGHAPTLMWR